MRPRVFITQPVSPGAVERLRMLADVQMNSDPLHIMEKHELLEAVRGCDILFCLLHDDIDADVIAANPKLRAVASMTITPANIAVAAATSRGIPVTVIPRLLLDDCTADIAFALILSVGRRVAEADRLVRAGTVLGCQSSHLEALGVSGCTIGLVGMGGVGRAAARRAQGFGMKILYSDPKRIAAEDERALGVEYAPLERLLAESDYVSIHAALTPQTRHLIGERELARMKPTAFLINTARGPIVDEAALIRALQQRKIAGAGLDVSESEPRFDATLAALPNVVITPHIGSAVTQVRVAMAHAVVDNIQAIVEGRRPPDCYNENIYSAQV